MPLQIVIYNSLPKHVVFSLLAHADGSILLEIMAAGLPRGVAKCMSTLCCMLGSSQ